mgnify:CR=1 FL=1
MKNMLHRMLFNSAYFEEKEIPGTLQGLEERVRERARQDGASGDSFLYEMIAQRRYADAEMGTQRMEIKKQVADLYTACFSYDSLQDFQVHDWLELNSHIGFPLMVVLRAAEDFTLEKGEVVICEGQVQDNWDHMSECWMWLMEQYECGMPPEEAVSRLKRLEKVLRDEEYDTDVRDLLESCLSHLHALSLAMQDRGELETALSNSLASGNFLRRVELEYMICEAVLWETQHLPKWEASLLAVMDAWKGVE